jgi:hypothetical protein
MRQIEIVETIKEKSAYNKKLKFLKKNHYDNVSAMNRTTDGNQYSRFKKDANYWLLKIKEFEAVRFKVAEIQNEIFEQFNKVEIERVECKVCQGAGQLPAYQDLEETEIIDYVDCICTDDRWDRENQDKCLDCGLLQTGEGCNWCDINRRLTIDLE